MPGARRIVGATMLAALTAATAPPPARPGQSQSPPSAKQAQPPLVAVGALQPGLWQLLVTDGGHTQPREICLGDARQLLQLRHGTAACTTLVVSNDAKVATVQYSCPGAGWGRTSLRPETPATLHIDSQGIADNAPFSLTVEGKRIAACPTPSASASAAAPAPAAGR